VVRIDAGGPPAGDGAGAGGAAGPSVASEAAPSSARIWSAGTAPNSRFRSFADAAASAALIFSGGTALSDSSTIVRPGVPGGIVFRFSISALLNNPVAGFRGGHFGGGGSPRRPASSSASAWLRPFRRRDRGCPHAAPLDAGGARDHHEQHDQNDNDRPFERAAVTVGIKPGKNFDPVPPDNGDHREKTTATRARIRARTSRTLTPSRPHSHIEQHQRPLRAATVAVNQRPPGI
jgi:hypothetical protein